MFFWNSSERRTESIFKIPTWSWDKNPCRALYFATISNYDFSFQQILFTLNFQWNGQTQHTNNEHCVVIDSCSLSFFQTDVFSLGFSKRFCMIIFNGTWHMLFWFCYSNYFIFCFYYLLFKKIKFYISAMLIKSISC